MPNHSEDDLMNDADLTHGRARFEIVFDHLPHGVFELDRRGHVLTMNPPGLLLYGMKDIEETVGCPYLDLVSDVDRERIAEILAAVVNEDELTYQHVGDGGLFLTSMLVPIRNSEGELTQMLGMTRDISDEKRNKAALDELQQRTALILQSAGEGIYGLDADGRLTFGNAAAEQIVGWQTAHVLGQKSHDVHHHTYSDGSKYPREECPIYAALKDGEVHRVDDEVFWHADGHSVPVEYTSTPILKDGQPDGAVVVFRDVTERRELEDQRAAAFDEIKQLKEQLEHERDYLRDEVNVTSHFGEIIGESQSLKRTLAQVEAVATTPANVVILGESGVGKEMIARAIHTQSDRGDKPLVKVNCASIPKDLFESEFFGHVKGAFTGAHRDRIGRLQLAAGGTLFLDEVGEIPLSQQGKLLRALQEHEFERVGDDETTKVDVRVVAATNRDLSEEVKAGRFREDLFYRLSVFPIDVPPLRERVEDIAPLAVHFLGQICREQVREPLRITQQQLSLLKAHRWPGNIRELRNVIERAVILSTGARLRLDLALPIARPSELRTANETPARETEFITDAEFRVMERANITAALRHVNWQVWGHDGAAELLGLNPSTLKYRMKQLGIKKDAAAT